MANAILLLMVLCAGWTMTAAAVFSTHPVNTPQVRQAPKTRLDWVKVIFAPNQYGTASLLSITGPDVDPLGPVFNQPFEITLHKSAVANTYCQTPPCYVGASFQVKLAFAPSTRYRRQYPAQQATVSCDGTWYAGTLKHPVVHAVGVQIYQNRLHFFCS